MSDVNHPGDTSHRRTWLLLSICLLVSALRSLILGQDGSWDARNYHLYNAWAFLHDRSSHDIAAASMQSYFNPLSDLPYFVLATGHLADWPRLLTALQGLWYGILLYVIFLIAFKVAELQQRKAGVPDYLAALIGATGTMAITQTGTLTNDIPLATFVLLGLYWVMPLFHATRTTSSIRHTLLAGICCGLAAGLKPTAVIYTPALGLALLFAPASFKENAKFAATFAMGAGAAFIAAYGWWGWCLYEWTGNPVFPLFNHVFHSDLIRPVSSTDIRFMPRDWAQWLFYPFYWLRHKTYIVNEEAFSDPRYALAMVSIYVLLIKRCITFFRTKHDSAESEAPITRLLVLFVVVAYVLWLVLFSILRYAMPIEALTGLLMLLAVRSLIPNEWQATKQDKWLKTTMIALCVLIAATTRYPHSERTAFQKQVFEVNVGAIEPGSMVLLGGIPSAYLAPFFPHVADIDFIGLNWFTNASRGYGLWNQIEQKIAAHRGPMYAVLRKDDQEDLQYLKNMVPAYQLGDCRHLSSNLELNKRNEEFVGGLDICRVLQKQASY
jgi:hypothetical protein